MGEAYWKLLSMRYCIRCGKRLRKSEKLEMCERCRKETLRQFLAQTLDDIEVPPRKSIKKGGRSA